MNSARCARPPTSSACRCSRKASIARRTFTSTSRPSRGRPFHYYAYGAAVSEVEVDGFTGQFRLLRTDILHDAGDSISPIVDRGQIEGGFLQGVGWLTIEELLWDAKGRVSTGGASTYKLPSWSEVPEVFNVEMLERATQPDVVMGSKAVGEPPLMLAFSVREALRDAIAAFGEGRAVHVRQPCHARARLLRRSSGAASGAQVMQLFRAAIFHTPENPFHLDIGDRRALVCHQDGGLLVDKGRVAACGDYAGIRDANPGADTVDWRGGFILPGFVDAHVHFPQVRIIGAMGRTLLDWLEAVALPEEARMADRGYAAETAGVVSARARLARHDDRARVRRAFRRRDGGALRGGRRVRACASRPGSCSPTACCAPTCTSTPERAYRESAMLIERYHKRGRLLYAVTPRFAYSTTEAMLEVCQQLMAEHPDVRLQTHINENPAEIGELARLFPWAADYLAIYERYELSGERSVMAHNVHAHRLRDRPARRARARLSRIVPAATRRSAAAVFRCGGTSMRASPARSAPMSAAALGFGMLKEGLQAYLMQRLAPDPQRARCRAIAVPGDARGRGGAWARDGDRRFSSPARPRTSSICVRRRAACSRRPCATPTIRRRRSRRCSRWRARRAFAKCASKGMSYSRLTCMTLDELNANDRSGFVGAVGWVFEDSPWVAERAWEKRPFATLDALHDAMTSSRGGRAARRAARAAARASGSRASARQMSDASEREQAGAGLDALTRDEIERLRSAERGVSREVRVSVPVCRQGQHEARYSQRARTPADVDARRRAPGSAAAGLPHRALPAGGIGEICEQICVWTQTPLLRQGRCHRLSPESRRQSAGGRQPGVRRERAAARSTATRSGRPTPKGTTAASSPPIR